MRKSFPDFGKSSYVAGSLARVVSDFSRLDAASRIRCRIRTPPEKEGVIERQMALRAIGATVDQINR